MFSKFFIDRPRFALVISIILMILGALAIKILPISQFPNITPPQVTVQTNYLGANAQVLTDTVAVPIENQINGVENMLYMSSTSDDNGSYNLTVTYDVSTIIEREGIIDNSYGYTDTSFEINHTNCSHTTNSELIVVSGLSFKILEQAVISLSTLFDE